MNNTFAFKDSAKELKFVDSWSIGVRSNKSTVLIELHVGFKDDHVNNKGSLLGSYIMQPEVAVKLLSDLQKMLPNIPPNQREYGYGFSENKE